MGSKHSSIWLGLSLPHVMKAFLIALSMILTWLICIQQGGGYSTAGVMSAMLFMTEKHSGAQLIRFIARIFATLLGGGVTFIIAQYYLSDILLFSGVVASIVVCFTFLASFYRIIYPNIAYIFSVAGLTICFCAFPTTYNISIETLNDIIIARVAGISVAIAVCAFVSTAFYTSVNDSKVIEEAKKFEEQTLQFVRKSFISEESLDYLYSLRSKAESILRQNTELAALSWLNFRTTEKLTQRQLKHLLFLLSLLIRINQLAGEMLSNNQFSKLKKILANTELSKDFLSSSFKKLSLPKELCQLLLEFVSLRESSFTFSYHKLTILAYKSNWYYAWHNAIRCALGLSLVLIFWYCTGWDKGANCMMITGTLFVMFASLPIPPKTGVLVFLAGHFICAIFAYILLFGVMPSVVHPCVLFAIIAVILWLFAYKHITSKMPMSIIYMFIILFWPVYLDMGNIPSFDELGFINGAIANILGGVAVGLSYILIETS